jgi:hypothetical protein
MEEIASLERIPGRYCYRGCAMPPNGHDEQELRRRARAALNQGQIPRDRPKGLWGGNGSGERCPVCAHPVEVTEMELEVEFTIAEVGAQGVREFHLHLQCFAAREIERQRV